MDWNKLARYALLVAMSIASLRLSAETTVRAHINFTFAKTSKQRAHRPLPNAVMWLVPVERGAIQVHPGTYKLEQKNKEFIPHLLVVPSGSTINFPNLDPFFHNVFSLFNGKRFDLGLYEKGQTRAVKFDHPGVSYIFCDIHPEMSAVVIALDTPYFGVASSDGNALITNVPPGEYNLKIWAEGASEMQLASLSHRVKVTSQDLNLGDVSVVENPIKPHKNKFGEDYLKPAELPY